jgi:undecaprenyl-diphosphatase
LWYKARVEWGKKHLSFLQIVVLAVVQGLTEFLPVSSSGHLILVPALTGWPDQGLALDVAAHVGTLLAVLIYFWRDVVRMARGLLQFFGGKRDPWAMMAFYLLIATIPALIVGYLVDRYAGTALRSPALIGWTFIVFGIVLYASDKIGLTVRRLEHIRLGHALVIGLAQAVAFIPGVSRSGITMVAARLMGFERAEAARFSFLLSIPAIAAGGIWKGRQLLESGSTEALHNAAWVCGLSAVAGFLAIAFLMAWLKRSSFTPFVIYRLLFGGVLLYLVYSGYFAK